MEVVVAVVLVILPVVQFC